MGSSRGGPGGEGDGPHNEIPTPQVEGAGEAVDLLLEEVREETQPQPVVHYAGLRGRTAVVTSGATGIGRATALEFGRCGANVAFTWQDLDGRRAAEAASQTESVLQQLEVGVHAEEVDVRDRAAVEAFVGRVRERFGGVHFLVNSAGTNRSAPIWQMADEDWREVIDVNLTGAFNTIRALAPVFREQRFGKIVNVASVDAFDASFGGSGYAASSAGLLALTRSAAVELGPDDVNVNAVASGAVRAEGEESASEDVIEELSKRAALRRVPDCQDVAHVVLFLCSDMARQITGQVIRVDGGLLG